VAKLTRLPPVQLLAPTANETLALNCAAFSPWKTTCQQTTVDGLTITGVWPTLCELQNHEVVHLLRHCKSPIHGYYEYVVKTAPTSHCHVAYVATDQGNALLELPNHYGAVPSLRLLTSPWVHTASSTLLWWIKRRLDQQLSLEEVMRVLQFLSNTAWGGNEMHATWNDPRLSDAKLLRRVFGETTFEDVILHCDGLFSRIATDLGQP
jgi:hypothetical protein